MEALRRKTVESFFMSGQLTKRRLLLGRGELKATSGNQRLVIFFIISLDLHQVIINSFFFELVLQGTENIP